MSLFSVLAYDVATKKWNTCHMISAADIESAIKAARLSRQSGRLSYVPHPSKFRLRRSSLREITSLKNFLNLTNNSSLLTYDRNISLTEGQLEGLLQRRRRLMDSFFIGLYLQPALIKQKYGGAPPAPPPSSPPASTTTGGIQSETSSDGKVNAPEPPAVKSEENTSHAQLESTEGSEAIESIMNALASGSDDKTDTSIDLDFL